MGCTMADLASLLVQCKCNPLDDTVRLVLSDFLEEHGDADRAEFVRLQVRDRSDDTGWEPDAGTNEVRAVRLYKQHVYDWCRGYLTNRYWFSLDPAGHEEVKSAKGKFERGTLTLSGSPSQVEQVIPQLPAHAVPWLERLRLNG